MYASRNPSNKLYTNIDDVLARFPQSAREGMTDGALHLRFDGREPCQILVQRGIARVVLGGEGSARATVNCSSDAFLELVSDRVEFRTLIQSGKLAIEGDLLFAYGIYSLLLKSNEEAAEQFRAVDTMARGAPLQEVPRVQRPTREQILDTLARNTPLIATGMMRDWRALAWTPERIADEYGDTSVVVEQQVTIPMREFIARMNETPSGGEKPAYVNGCPLPESMYPDVQPPPWFPHHEIRPPQLWMGAPAGDRPSTYLHRDGAPVFLGQVYGRKRVVLFCPDQTPYMYSAAIVRNSELIDPDHFDRDRYPLLARAFRTECIIEPGDILVLPVGWYHCVWALTPNISIAHAYGEDSAWSRS
ncbi:cupin-like domain-containing protein [Pendulispora albinea]|uniref:Cupin-like domain-containing protein n=1 Tax=Pendulispora albinea TaxID=2741071 RepID=A0ABZ2LT88_9BACT